MPQIRSLYAREILDSKGDPTVEVTLTLSDGTVAVDAAPSGASTGTSESLELRDSDPDWFAGKGVQTAVSNINELIFASLKGREFSSQSDFDQSLITLDGTPNKNRLGANALLPVSLSFARAVAASQHHSLFAYIGDHIGNTQFVSPRPAVLVLEGGKHGAWATDVQEFMILPSPDAFPDLSHTYQACSKVVKSLEELLLKKHYSTGVGFEGAFCPDELSSNEEAFNLIVEAIALAGFSIPDDFTLAIDAASSEFYSDGLYILPSENNQMYSLPAWTEKVLSWLKKYPISSIEDPFDQSQWSTWKDLMLVMGHNHQIVADDLTTTNVDLLKKAIDEKAANAVIIKPNQIGTLTETFSAVILAKEANFTPIVSHRAGETPDDFIADLAVGAGCPQTKFGGLNRGERISKYNRLLAIETLLKS